MATPPRKRASPVAVQPANDDAPNSTAAKSAPKLTKQATLPKQAAAPNAAAAKAKPKLRKAAGKSAPAAMRQAKFSVGSVVRHRVYPFRGVVFDIDPVFNNTEDWWQAIPEEIRPRKDQPFYHLLAENSETTYVAYVSEQNLLADKTGQPVRHPQVKEMFALDEKGRYRARFLQSH
jgi:heat shock protein HspQ